MISVHFLQQEYSSSTMIDCNQVYHRTDLSSISSVLVSLSVLMDHSMLGCHHSDVSGHLALPADYTRCSFPWLVFSEWWVLFVVLAKASVKTRLDHWTGPLDWTTGLD